ncbi:unnamed protein product [Aphis gossypii]|uniref:Uncharacterized protein n=1 Tax=Aphis gossypii TaxID=80765 RepID=A0A9P0INI0_APHGO|nr:unnamed protein product [Aphis gossypii]
MYAVEPVNILHRCLYLFCHHTTLYIVSSAYILSFISVDQIIYTKYFSILVISFYRFNNNKHAVNIIILLSTFKKVMISIKYNIEGINGESLGGILYYVRTING